MGNTDRPTFGIDGDSKGGAVQAQHDLPGRLRLRAPGARGSCREAGGENREGGDDLAKAGHHATA
jgi:hypothetical protein